MNDRVFQGSDRLRNPDRLARLEIGKVTDLCLEDARIRTVLDVGTGSGVFAEAFAARGREVAGIDIQEAMLEAARAAVPGARFMMASSESLPFEDGAFDLVFMGLVFHETDDPARSMAEAFRVSARTTALLEWPHAEQPFGPPVADRLTEAQVRTFGREAGFAHVRVIPLTALVLYLFDKRTG
jgi:ubiquinone/menaquinone biosynthesis C-methylase UbiE